MPVNNVETDRPKLNTVAVVVVAVVVVAVVAVAVVVVAERMLPEYGWPHFRDAIIEAQAKSANGWEGNMAVSEIGPMNDAGGLQELGGIQFPISPRPTIGFWP